MKKIIQYSILFTSILFLNSCFRFYNKAYEYYENGNIKEAIIEYEKYIEENPNDFESYENLSNIYEEKKDYIKAIEYIKEVIKVGISYNKKAIKTGISYNNKIPQQYYKLAELFLLNNDREEAKNTYNNAIDYCKNQIRAYKKMNLKILTQPSSNEEYESNSILSTSDKYINVYSDWIVFYNEKLKEI